VTYVPHIENTQIYSDDESSKADKYKEKIYLGITTKTKHSRE
jgi:hypothetical protein